MSREYITFKHTNLGKFNAPGCEYCTMVYPLHRSALSAEVSVLGLLVYPAANCLKMYIGLIGRVWGKENKQSKKQKYG